ncbi:hypothetical protein VNO77_30458 [Canavalia gladiata]|uniref:Polygalacturonase n=1 Tax=Canavalia gladiata TaxID=3824 RepID=A0AAN9KRJ1_CANGL
MDLLIIDLLIFLIVSCNSWVGHSQDIFDVLKYGAKGDGRSNDTQAFGRAWNDLCESNQSTVTLVIPAKNTFLLQPTSFKGPCKSQNVNIKIEGTLLAPKREEWAICTKRWLHFVGVRSISLTGSGEIDGQGYDWWGVALQFERCDNLKITGTTHKNGPGWHIHIFHSNDVTITNVTINAPPKSHNTDGIDLLNSARITIVNSHISSGDDCVAVKGGTQFVNIDHITCGVANHGISVGSLGQGGLRESVEHLNVSNCIFNGGTSGVKIKTWPDIAVKVVNITFNNIHGTSLNENTIMMDCAKIGCDNITLNDINIVSIDPKKPASSTCKNVKGTATKVISPHVPCLS